MFTVFYRSWWRTYYGSYTQFFGGFFLFRFHAKWHWFNSNYQRRNIVAIVSMLLLCRCINVCACVCAETMCVHCSMRLSNGADTVVYRIIGKSDISEYVHVHSLRWWSICAVNRIAFTLNTSHSQFNLLFLVFFPSIFMQLYLRLWNVCFFSLSIFLPSSATCDSSVAIRIGRVCGKCMLLKQQQKEKKLSSLNIAHTGSHAAIKSYAYVSVCFIIAHHTKWKWIKRLCTFVWPGHSVFSVYLYTSYLVRSAHSFFFFAHSTIHSLTWMKNIFIKNILFHVQPSMKSTKHHEFTSMQKQNKTRKHIRFKYYTSFFMPRKFFWTFQ